MGSVRGEQAPGRALSWRGRVGAAACMATSLLSGCHLFSGLDELVLREDAKPLWSVPVAGHGYQSTRALAAVPEGIYALIEHDSGFTLDAQSMSPQGGVDMALVQFLPNGRLNWMRSIGSFQSEYGGSMVATEDGVLLTGFFSNNIKVAGQTVYGQEGPNILIAKLSSSGQLESQHVFAGDALAGPQGKLAVAQDQEGNIILGGTFVAGTDFGCGQLSAQGPVDAYVAKLDDRGCLWSRSLGDSKEQRVEDVAVELGGDVVVAGEFTGTVDFGGGAQLNGGGGVDAFVAKLGPNGTHRWSKRYGDSGGAVSSVRVAVHRLGNVTLTGYFQGRIDFGDGPVTARQGHDLFVVKLDPNGNGIWSKHIPLVRSSCTLDDCELDHIDAVTDMDGNLIVTGHFRGEVDFGGTTLVSAGGTDMYVAKLDPNGKLLWSGEFGDDSHQCESPKCFATAAVDSDGSVVIGGGYLGGMDFGDGGFPEEEDGGGFIVKLAP